MGDNRFMMVSEWMTNGDINGFVKARRDVNRFELVGFSSDSLLHVSLITVSISLRTLPRDWYTCTMRGSYMVILKA